MDGKWLTNNILLLKKKKVKNVLQRLMQNSISIYLTMAKVTVKVD